MRSKPPRCSEWSPTGQELALGGWLRTRDEANWVSTTAVDVAAVASPPLWSGADGIESACDTGNSAPISSSDDGFGGSGAASASSRRPSLPSSVPAYRTHRRRGCRVAWLGPRCWRCRHRRLDRRLDRCCPCRCCRRNAAPPVLVTTGRSSPSNPRYLAARPLPAARVCRPVRSSTLSQRPWPTTLPTMCQSCCRR